ncbi:MAG: prepilin peptidase [Acidimicrobiales bacterium]
MTVVSGVMGVLVGSFLNVIVYRVPRGLSIVQPRSFCPRCGNPVRSLDNIPVVSWLVLGGKCRACGMRISGRYPLVEAGCGAMFAAIAWALGPHWAVPGFCVLGATMAALAAVELDRASPPTVVAAFGAILGLVLLAGAAVADRRWAHLAGAAAGLVVAGLVVVGLVIAGARKATSTRAAVTGAKTDRPVPWSVGLPAGVGLGWLGPIGAAIGAAIIVLLVGVWVVVQRTGGKDRRSRAGIATAVAAASALAVVATVALGIPVGR